MGEDHQQQRARVAPGAPDTCRPGGEAGGPAGAGEQGGRCAPRGAGTRGASTLLARAWIQGLDRKSAESLPPRPEPAPGAGSWGHPETLHPSGEGTPSLPATRTHLLPVGLSLPPE